MTGIRLKHTIRLPAELSGRLADYASRKRVSQALVVETAIASFLSPDGSERLEAAIGRRLDRMIREQDRLAWNVDLTNETLALFIRFWLVTNAPLPDTALAAAQAMGRERWEQFVESLSRRMEQGRRLGREISEDRLPKGDIGHGPPEG
ncbi:MAG: CopG protein [Bradyrhizobium sp.]|nr:CopG protein [Bradyrhizobium sp.]